MKARQHRAAKQVLRLQGLLKNTLREGRAVWRWLDLIGERCLRLEIAKILLASEFKYMLAGAECH